MQLNKILTLFFIYLIIHVSGSIDVTTELPFNSGGDLYITNNPISHDPTYSELLSFLQNDTTDTIPYNPKFMCGEFATLLHNNAESQGIRSSVVNIRFHNTTVGHAINAFNTTDRGLIFIDCTSAGNPSDDKFAAVELNSTYSTTSVFYPQTFNSTFKSFTVGSVTFQIPFTSVSGYSYSYSGNISKYTIFW